MEITKTTNADPDFLRLCSAHNDVMNKTVAEQRYPNAHSLLGLEEYPTVFLARVDGVAVGCIAISDVATDYKRPYADIGRVFVDEKFRGRGIATELLKHAERCAKQMGAKMLTLDTYERLPNAVALYKKCGFTPVSQFLWIINSPFSLCMEKEL